MLYQAVYILHRCARSGRDTLTARCVQHAHRNTFLFGHRQNNRFLPLYHIVIDTGGSDLFLHFTDTRQHAHDTAQTTHFLKLANLAKKVIHVELAFGHALCQTFGFFGLDAFGSLFNQRHHIAHIKNTASQTCRIKFFQRILLFTDTDKFDRTAGDLPHRQRSTATRITIKTRQHNAGHTHRIIKGSRSCYRILTGHGIGNQQYFMRVCRGADITQFGHQRFIDTDPACRIQNKHVIGL